MTFISSYRDRPDTLKVEHRINNNGKEGSVYSLNGRNVTVWDDGTVTAQRKYHRSSSPEKHFPNMMVIDGTIHLPIEDLCEFILMRITPLELAEGIIADDEAREALIEKMGERYSSPGFDDKDRRIWLTKVQAAVHSVALDAAIEKLNKLEEANRAKSDYYRWKSVELGHYKGIYEYVCTLLGSILSDDPSSEKRLIAFKERHTSPDQLDECIKQHRDPAVKESVGQQWHESRDFWRTELLKVFAPPAIPEEESIHPEIPF